jgi:ADP-ribose pyrophosphatase
MNFKIKKSEIVFHGKVFDVKVDNIEYNNSSNTGVREVAIHKGGAVIVPVKNSGKIIMVTQYRYPFNEFLLELPAGKLDEGEEPLNCADRELTEETGYKSNNIIKLGEICTTPGFCTEILSIYLAKELVKGAHKREEGEDGMQVFEFTLDEIEEKIRTGEIVDAKTICGIHYYKNLVSNQNL